jgi:hypothetical protein
LLDDDYKFIMYRVRQIRGQDLLFADFLQLIFIEFENYNKNKSRPKFVALYINYLRKNKQIRFYQPEF